jgi:hypothetical protein
MVYCKTEFSECHDACCSVRVKVNLCLCLIKHYAVKTYGRVAV